MVAVRLLQDGGRHGNGRLGFIDIHPVGLDGRGHGLLRGIRGDADAVDLHLRTGGVDAEAAGEVPAQVGGLHHQHVIDEAEADAVLHHVFQGEAGAVIDGVVVVELLGGDAVLPHQAQDGPAGQGKR